MKKLFLLIPALFIAMMMNAKEIEVSSGTSNIIHFTIAASTTVDGDVLILKDAGPYVSTNGEDYTKLSKNITIKAKAGITPVIKLQVPIQGRNGKSAKFIGIKFDCSDLKYDNLVHFNDAQDNELEFEDCEFYNSSRYLVKLSSDKKVKSLKFKNCKFYNNSSTRGIIIDGTGIIGHLELDGCEVSGFVKEFIHGYNGNSHVGECIINNCYFHNNSRSAVLFTASTVDGSQTCDQLTVTNSTFANINATGEYESVIDIRPYGSATTDAISLIVDHCTFYNNTTINTDHADIRAANISNIAISNCIFAHPEAYGRRATYCYGGTVKNCLTYNLTEDADHQGHTWMSTRSNCIVADPLFTDAANGDLSFAANNWVTKNLSPACGVSTDGIDLGDPRWHTTAPVLPSVDFATAYDFVGAEAQLVGNIQLNSSNDIEFISASVPGFASWRIHVSKACAVKATIDMETGTTSGNKFRVYAYDAKGNAVDSVVNGYNEKSDADINVSGTIYFPTAGDYAIRLYNAQSWSSAKVEKVILSYAGGAVQNLPCTTDINEAWYAGGGTRTDGQITYSSWSDENAWVKWNASTSADIFCNVTLRINTTNAHHFAVNIYEEGHEEALATLSEKYSSTTGDNLDINLGRVHIAADKNLLIKVTNPVSGSAAKVVSLKFEEVVIPTIAMPGTLNPLDAMLSERAWVDTEGAVDSLLFTARGDEGYNSSQWAKWKISTTERAYYKFTLNAYTGTPAKAQQYILSVLSNDESQVIATKTTKWDNKNNEYTDYVCAELLPGNYIVKVQNPEWGSTGRVLNIDATYDGGAFTEIPTDPLLGDEAMLNATKLTRDENNDIKYNDNGTPTNEFVKWNIHVTNPDEMEVTFNVVSGGHQFSLELYKEDVLLNTIGESAANWNTSVKLDDHLTFAEAGDYQLKLINNQENSVGILHSITFAPYVAPEPIVIDENATANGTWADYYDTNEPIDLSISRTLKGGMYNTICLPFELGSQSSMENAFGAGYELLALSEATLEGGVLSLIFEQKTTLEYGKPYLIKPVNDVVNPSFTGRKIKTITPSYYTKGVVDFVGTLVKTDLDAEHDLFLGLNNTLYFPSNSNQLKGLRGYFHINITNAQQAVKHARIVKQGQVITAIDLVNEQNEGTIKTIENGQLIIIRDGVRYNAMGVMIQ